MLGCMFPMSTDRRVRLATLVVLALVHAIVLTWFTRLAVSPERRQPPPSQSPLFLRLLDWVQPSNTGIVQPPLATSPTTSKATSALPPRAAATSPTITLPDTTPAAPDAATAGTPAPTATVPAPADTPAPLNLVLPRAASAAWRQRPTPMDDPRANTAKATFESKLQAAMGGDGRWLEERIDGDRVRFRRGDTCVDFTRTRAEQLDSFNQSFSPKPWVTPGPKPC
jgi:hypothetical protein